MKFIENHWLVIVAALIVIIVTFILYRLAKYRERMYRQVELPLSMATYLNDYPEPIEAIDTFEEESFLTHVKNPLSCTTRLNDGGSEEVLVTADKYTYVFQFRNDKRWYYNITLSTFPS